MERSEEEIRELIVTLTQGAVEPTLAETEIDLLVRQARRRDRDNRRPDQDGWIPTWSVNGAVAMGWEMKAGKVSNMTTFSSGTQKVNRQELITNFMAMSDRWKQRDNSDVALPSSMARHPIGIHTAHDECWDLLWGIAGGGHGWAIPGQVQWIDDP